MTLLPDFLKLKRQIADDRADDLRSAEREDSIVSLISQVHQHEGDRFTIIQEDQTVRTNTYRKIEVEGTHLGHNRGKDAIGFPSPYWLQEKALAFRYGKLPPADVESFRLHSYTVHSALDMLVRRLCRQAVRGYWKRVSKLTHCDFIPEQPCDWFRWRCKEGDSRMALFPLSKSWAEWRLETATVQGNLVPVTLIANPDWLLPFALVFPHRVNRTLSAIIDAIVGERAKVLG